MTGEAWLLKLLATAALLGGYPVPLRPPDLTVLPQHDLAMRVCGAACPVRGAYGHAQGILISDALDLDGDPVDRSVLLHEAVHFLQEINGRFADEDPCDRYRDREIQAYDIQDRYLARYNRGVGHVAASLEWSPAACAAGGAPTAQAERASPRL